MLLRSCEPVFVALRRSALCAKPPSMLRPVSLLHSAVPRQGARGAALAGRRVFSSAAHGHENDLKHFENYKPQDVPPPPAARRQY